MTVGVPNFQGSRLTEARLARGLFKKALADMIGVTPMAITRYEAGVDRPQIDRLHSIAEKLSFPVEFFLHPSFDADMGPVFWRNRANDSKFAREMTEQRMTWLCEIFNAFENELEFADLDIPELDLPPDFRAITPAVIERSAEAVRKAWGFRDQPIPDMILAVENAGVPVVTLDIQSDKQDGFHFHSRRLGRPFIGINVYEVSACRARFDAAHEFGHLLLHRNVTKEQEKDKALHRIIEQQAHRFAGALLFPRDAFISEVRFPSLDYFCALKKRWGISIAAMIMRASDLGLIDPETKLELHKAMGRRRWRGSLREPFDHPTEMPLERPRMLRRGFQALIDNGIYSRSTFRSSMRLPDNEVEQIVGLPPGYLGHTAKASSVVTLRPKVVEAVDLESGNVVQFPGRKAN